MDNRRSCLLIVYLLKTAYYLYAFQEGRQEETGITTIKPAGTPPHVRENGLLVNHELSRQYRVAF